MVQLSTTSTLLQLTERAPFTLINKQTRCVTREASGTHQVSKLDGGDPGLDDGPQTPEEVGRQGEPKIKNTM